MKNCANCKKELSQKEKESKKDFLARKFCDRSCAASCNNRKFPKREKADLPLFKVQCCERCHGDFNVRLCKTASKYIKRKYCDTCVRVTRLEARGHNIEIVSLRTKDDLFSTRKNWQSARTAIRVHAEKIINKSGKEKICNVCQYSNHVEICHIKSVSDFSGDSTLAEINNLSNLIYLCPNHHWEFDNELLQLK